MPDIVTHFTNNLKNTDREHNRLKPKAFIHPDTSEISVVCIDTELTLSNAHEIIFAIGDKIYPSNPRVKARGDMKVCEIEQIRYGEENNLSVHVEHAPTEEIPTHYNIKPELVDLEFANICAHRLSRISSLFIK